MKISFVTAFCILLFFSLFIWNLHFMDGFSTKYREEIKITRANSELENRVTPQKKSKAGNDLLVSLKDNEDRYIVTVKTPGPDISDIDVKLVDRNLTLSFKSSNAASHYENGNVDVTYLSRYMGQFSKTITLPGPIAANKIISDFKNDTLTVTIPKK